MLCGLLIVQVVPLQKIIVEVVKWMMNPPSPPEKKTIASWKVIELLQYGNLKVPNSST